jgi:hypothetical protein
MRAPPPAHLPAAAREGGPETTLDLIIHLLTQADEDKRG